MAKEFLDKILLTFAKVTKVVVDSGHIKEDLDNASTRDFKSLIERTKTQIDDLDDLMKIIKEDFYAQYNELLETLNEPEPNNLECADSEKATNSSHKTGLKLVDINKLMSKPLENANQDTCDINSNKSKGLDGTVVILSSTDDETPAPTLKKLLKTQCRASPVRPRPCPKSRRPTLSLRSKYDMDSETDDDVPIKHLRDRAMHHSVNKNNKKTYGTRKGSSSSSSDSSSSQSDSDDTIIRKKIPSKSSKQNRKTQYLSQDQITEDSDEFDYKNDTKINSNCYVKLIKVPFEKLKEQYLEKLELLEVNKLSNLKSLKRSRTRSKKILEGSGNETSGSSSGSDNHRNNKKRKVRTESTEKEISANEADSDKEEQSKNDDTLSLEIDPQSKKIDEADVILDTLKGTSDNETPDLSLSDSHCEDRSTTKVDDDANTETSIIDAPVDGEENNKSDEEKQKSEDRPKGDELKDGDGKKSDNDMKSDDNKKNDDESNEEMTTKKSSSKSKWRRDKCLTSKLSSSDSGEEFKKFQKKKESQDKNSDSDDARARALVSDKKAKKKGKRRTKKNAVIDSDDSDDAYKNEKNSSDDSHANSSTSKSSSSSSSEYETKKSMSNQKKGGRRRIKRIKDSSDEDGDAKSTRKHIRGIIGRESLAASTLQAEAEEKKRKERIQEKQRKYNQFYEEDLKINTKLESVVLDRDENTNEEILSIDKDLVSKLKPHQASGIQFMWDACFENVKRAKETTGGGCILAHCMGLGKTLQLIALSHTLLTHYEKTNVKKILVVCPLNTVLNWVSEFKQWLPDNDDFEIFELVSCKQNYERQYQVKTWHECGGVLVMGYEMFRNLSNPENKRISKKMRDVFAKTLVDPGPDLVVCDEGHLLKNEKTNLSIAMNRVRTLRRIVLTGTPLQNNMKEYFCMVQFIKPNLLGTYVEYLNRFVNPITNGQYTDSTQHDIQIMRKRSHVLHKMLDGVVQRRDYSVLQPYLPPKHEYVLFLNLTEVQVKLYTHYKEHISSINAGQSRSAFIFADFQNFQRICTHPRVLFDKSIEERNKGLDDEAEDSEGSLKDFIDDGSDTSANSSESGSDKSTKKAPVKARITRATAATATENGETIDLDVGPSAGLCEWWQEYCDGKELDKITHSSKLFLFFQILKECEQIGDKILVFSQSLYTLNVLEYFLGKITEATESGGTVDGFSGSWCRGLDYFRLDGSTSCDNRSIQCKMFNDPENTRTRLFLISTKAGGLGINLVGANRVIIFDASWNPSHDVQSIYRVYRFGQTKPCYIYRFITKGTMEMKIYERQVTKQAISKRVIDEQQIDRHYNQNDLQELYMFDPSTEDRPIPLVPKDVLLGEMLQKYEDRIYSYHEHQSLLENKEDEVLDEEERKLAWEEFENEKVQRQRSYQSDIANKMNPQNIYTALARIISRENPGYSEADVKMLLPTLQLQLQQEISRGELTLYRKVQNEFHILQRQQQEQYIQQQLLMNPHHREYIQKLFERNPTTSRSTNQKVGNEIIDLDK